VPGAAGLAFTTVFGLFVCGVILAVAALRLLYLYLEREIDGFELAVSLCVLFSFAIGIFLYWRSHVKWLLSAMFATLCIAVVLLGRRQERQLARRLRQDDFDRCYRLLQFDPRNASAHARLGDLFMQEGHVDQAMASYQNAVALAPRESEARARLQRAIETKQRMITDGVDCPRCGARSVRGSPYCVQCRFPLSARHEFWDALRTPETLRYSQIGAVICLSVVLLALGVQFAVGHVSIALIVTAFVFLFATALLFLGTRLVTK
jgi:tetratricopeptide (TPR) repeat protein